MGSLFIEFEWITRESALFAGKLRHFKMGSFGNFLCLRKCETVSHFRGKGMSGGGWKVVFSMRIPLTTVDFERENCVFS